VHAEAKSLDKAIQFLSTLKAQIKSQGFIFQGLRVYDPVPKAVMRVAGTERAQLLIESDSRKQLQEVLEAVDRGLRENSQGRISKTARVRWLIERDPITI
jgi:primosomal protein N' (replication factor Y)